LYGGRLPGYFGRTPSTGAGADPTSLPVAEPCEPSATVLVPPPTWKRT
jgi:hypothetical protein